MKKFAVIGSALTAVLTAGAIAVPVLAASNPADDASTYSYNTGNQAYEERMAEEQEWYDNEDESVTADYSFNTGSQTAQVRNNTFAEMPAGDDVAKEDVEAWFEESSIGEEAAWTDGQYDESAKANYGYAKGQAAYQQRHASFSEEN